jgi:hypothetical protein
MSKKRIPIDPDILQRAEALLREYLTIITPVEGFNFDETAYKIAKYPQELRNLDKKLKRKAKQERFRIEEKGSATNPYSVHDGDVCLGNFPSRRVAEKFMRNEMGLRVVG